MKKDILLPLEASKEKTFKKAFQYEFYPTEEQKVLLAKTFGCCRFVYNECLKITNTEYDNYIQSTELYKAGKNNQPLPKPIITEYALINKVTQIKTNLKYQWLYEVSSVALQQTAIDLSNAYSRFFKHLSNYPQTKKKHAKQSFRLMTTAFKIDIQTGFLTIAKSDTLIKLRYSRPLPCQPSRVIISKLPCGKYIATFLCEVQGKKTHGTGKIGIDLGIKDFAVFSDGTRISNEKYLNQSQQKLRRLQQSLCRKQKGSNNRAKARIKVAKLHYHITQQRKDFQHKLSTQLVNENQVICLESLRPANMIKNRKLSKHIGDVSWSSFKEMLIYKANQSLHCNIVFIDPFYPSSHLCNKTGEKLDRKLKLSDRTWNCPHCGKAHDRDLNAAKNIRDEGLYRLRLIDSKDEAKGMVILAYQ